MIQIPRIILSFILPRPMTPTFPGQLIRSLLFLVGFISFVDGQEASSLNTVRFVDVAKEVGMDFQHNDGSSGQQYLVELMGAGVAVLDYDLDGWLDIYLLNGCQLPESSSARPSFNALFRNKNGRFTNVAKNSSTDDLHYGLSVTAADIDHDGFADLFVGNFHSQILFRNMGDGTFQDETQLAGLATPDRFAAGCCFLDANADGNLDLFVGRYVNFSYERHQQIAPGMFPYPPGPKDYPHTANSLFLNQGDGKFGDASRESGIAEVRGASMGCVAGDFDQDNDIDLIIAGDTTPGLFFENDGLGHFIENGTVRGVAFGKDGVIVGGMGVEAGDLDNDLKEDLFLTDYTVQKPLLFRNLGDGVFEERSQASRVVKALFPHTNWGVAFLDADLDGNRDIFVANGHLLKNVQQIESITDFKVPNTLFINAGKARFDDVSLQSGPGLSIRESSRGCAVADLDLDGDLDVVVLNCNSSANLLRNDLVTDRHWIQLDLVGTQTNRDANGAKAYVHAGDSTQFAEVRSGRGYQSHYGQRLHFGVGGHRIIEKITIDWNSRSREEWHNVPVDQIVQIVQGSPEFRVQLKK